MKPKPLLILLFAVLSLSVLLLSSNATAANSDYVYSIQIKYNQENVTISNLLKASGKYYPSINEPESGYSVELLSSKQKVLHRQLFNFDLTTIVEGTGTEHSEIILNEISSVELVMPYFSDVAYIVIKDPKGIAVAKLSLSSQSQPDIQSKASPGFFAKMWLLIKAIFS